MTSDPGERSGTGNAALAPSILLLEDDDDAADAVEALCDKRGWTFARHIDADSCLAAAQSGSHDILVLDRILAPGVDALEMVGRLREAECSIPAIVLSSIGQSFERARGLDEGADLYLTKPCEEHELAAAIGAQLRRHGFGKREAALFTFGKLELRRNSGSASWDGAALTLSPQSFELLDIIAAARGQCVRRSELWRRVWPEWVGGPQNTLIDQAIFRLRRELAATTDQVEIRTRRRRGYLLELHS
ncbi:hypothetical protein CD351_02530 [Erythrobacter sp. KY5]|uniref:response regulator transcription factor n=1 Tax=Erythrobacter sp. KY5 TaxID=2011159 RepID=UPI000DBEFFE1|nr:response regulator transcription factor [Erythrobacter sp. KY5]AWW73299.1 hypothetical protein CD351_02530 [Erythrobacter sp. KY5]